MKYLLVAFLFLVGALATACGGEQAAPPAPSPTVALSATATATLAPLPTVPPTVALGATAAPTLAPLPTVAQAGAPASTATSLPLPTATPRVARAVGTPTPTPFGRRLRRGRRAVPPPQDTFVASLTPRPTASWTFMTYVNADNNLENFGVEDVIEMAFVGSTSQVNVLVQMDRHADFTNGPLLNIPNFTTAKRFYVKQDEVEELAELGEIDSADPAQLTDFIKWSVRNFPARNYLLVLWDHGGGWRGVGLDETNGTFMTIPKAAEALANSGVKLSILGFDACLMGSVEAAYECSASADFMVGSQELEPGFGWDYVRILEPLTARPNMGPRELSRLLVDAYIESYEEVDPLVAESLTMSAYDLAQINQLTTRTRALADALKKELSATRDDAKKAELIANLEAARVQSPGFGRTGPFQVGEFFDLGRLAANAAQFFVGKASIQSAAAGVADAVEQTIFYQRAGTSRGDATGV